MRSYSLLALLCGLFINASLAAAAVTCRADDSAIIALNEGVRNAVDFCNFWVLKTRLQSAIDTMTTPEINAACDCIKSKPKLARSTMQPPSPLPAGSSTVRNLVKLKNALADPVLFCRFWNSTRGRRNTPMPEFSVGALYNICTTVLDTATSSSSSSSSLTPTTSVQPTTTLLIVTTTSSSSSTTKAMTTKRSTLPPVLPTTTAIPSGPVCPNGFTNGQVVLGQVSSIEIQCQRAYKGDLLASSTAATFVECAVACEINLDCGYASWAVSSKQCNIYLTVSGAPITPPSTAMVHSMKRTYISGPKNLMVNPTLQGTGSVLPREDTMAVPGYTFSGFPARFTKDGTGRNTLELYADPALSYAAQITVRQTVTGFVIGKFYRKEVEFDTYAEPNAVSYFSPYVTDSLVTIEGPMALTGKYQVQKGVLQAGATSLNVEVYFLGGRDKVPVVAKNGVLIKRVGFYGPYDTIEEAETGP